MKIYTAGSSERFGTIYRNIQRHIPEDHTPGQSQRRRV